MEETTKSLEYAYPTSDDANRLGYGSKGCWMVAIRGAKSETVIGERAFATKAEAVETFNAIEAQVYAWSQVA